MSNRRALSNAVKESKQPKKLSKPKDIDYNSIMGYRDDSPFRNKSSIDINTPTGTIDMSNTGIPLMANGRYLPPYSGTHQFNTNQVTETPLAQAKKGGGLKRKKEIQQPGQWAGVTPELVQPGNEAFELPNTPSVPAEFQTMDCPIFHKYDPNVGECVPFTEEEKAAYGLDYMKNWTQSPMHEQMLRASIEKDAPAGNIDNYVKDITDLRLRATDPNISFLPTGKDAPIGEADPYNLYDSKYTNGKKVYDPLFNSENEQDILNEKKLDTPLYLQSGVNNLNFYKSNTPNNKDLKSQAIFYTKNLPGEHAYVYPHEFSHLQDMGGGLIPASDYKTMESGVLPGTVSYNKIKEISKKYNIDSDISKNDPETYKKYLEEISDVYKKEYPKYRKYDADKKLYETDYNKYKVQRNEGDIINSPSDNSMPYEEFTQKHLANKFFTDIDERKDYIGLDTEARARLNAIRMYGKASGIYDPYTEKLTPEKYNQIQNLFNEQNPNASDANQLRQLQEVYKDEDILNMLNTISKNDTKENDTEVYTAKRGGTLKSKKYSRSLNATNKFFKEHAFFEKPKKLSKKRIYDPNAKYYQDGGLTLGTSTSYPSGVGVGNLANYIPSQMANLKLANSFKLKDVKTPLEIGIGTPLGGANSRTNTYQSYLHPDTNVSSVTGPAMSSSDIIDLNKANFNADQSSSKGIPLDLRVKQSFYGVTQNKNNPLRGYASIQGGYHPQTGFNAGAEGGLNAVISTKGKADRYFSDRGLIPKQTVFVPQLTMGFGVKQKHKGWNQNTLNEYENLLNQDAQNNTTNSLDYLNKEGAKGHLTGSRTNFGLRPQLTIESRPTRSPLILHGTVGANMNLSGRNRSADASGGTRSQNTFFGEVGARYPVDKLFDKKSKAKSKIQEVQDREQEYERERPIKPIEQKEPEEQTEWIGEHPRWLRDGGSAGDYIELDIPKDQIQKYVDGGYIVEDISVPQLNTYQDGGTPKSKWIAPADMYGYSKIDPATGLVYKNLEDFKVKAGKKGFGKKVKSFFQKDLGKLTKEAEELGKGIGYIAGVQGDIEPAVYNREGLNKFKSEVKKLKADFNKELKTAEKKRLKKAEDREEYDNAVKKKKAGDMSTDKFARLYKEKGWADKYDPATMKEGYKGQFQDAVDEANARKTENYEAIKNLAGELSGYNAAGRIYDDPLGALKGVGQTVADVASLPVGLTTGAYNYATEGNFDMGKNIIGQNYGEGIDEVGDIASVLPFGSMLGTAGKAAKLTKAGDVAEDLGKFITTQTPVKNTYKVLGRDSKFFNPGEKPNWLKGYQETWDPEIADLSPLKEFDAKLKTSGLDPKFKKQYQKIINKNNSITRNYHSNIEKAKKDPELIKKAEIERQSAMAEMTGVTNKFYDDVLNYNIKKYSPFEKELGSGSFGRVFSIPGSNKVVKIGRQAPGEIPEELIKKAQGLDKPNVALPRRIENLEGVVDATVMNKVDNLENSPDSIMSGTQIKPSSQAYEQLAYDIQDLQDRGLYVDFQNPDNIIFNPQTGKFHIYDLNTTGHYMSRKITPEMGYDFKPLTQFPGIQVPDPKGHSVLKILKDEGQIPENFQLPRFTPSETKKISETLEYKKANPYHTRDINEGGYGKDLISEVSKGPGDEYITLKKHTQPSGEEAYYFSANMKNKVEAGKAFKKLESDIPKGAIIQEPGSLSLDSWSALLRQAQNPKKFQVYPGNKVPLNTSAVHNKLPNQDKLLKGLEDENGWESKIASYATREDAQEAADYINTLIPKEFRATKANVFQVDPTKQIFNVAVPNYRIKKLYKQGGVAKDYIELDIPKSKIQEYIDQGYIIEKL